MPKNTFKKILLAGLLALPAGVFAQIAGVENRPPSNTEPINRYDLLDKTWYFVATKCPDKIGAETHYIHYFMTLRLTAGNVNNINYGTYKEFHRDMSESPDEEGKYSITTDDVGNVVLTLKKNKSNMEARYNIPFVETNHLTLIRIDEGDKCNISYAIAP
jgi:hypothetical protein